MDGTSTRRRFSGPWLRTGNLLASVGVSTTASALYGFAPYNQRQIEKLYGTAGFSIAGSDFLVRATLAYMTLLVFYYLLEREPRASKSLTFLCVAADFVRSPWTVWNRGLSPEYRVAVLGTLLKVFFAPMMTMSLMIFFMNALVNGIAILNGADYDSGFRTLFDRHGFWFLIQLILFIDVGVFTIGYLVEIPRLGNSIRSVDPTMMGWGVALICYPPFNKATGFVLGSPVSDFPRFDDPTAHLSLNLALLALMAIYASASVALGFKASNLTYRGIVARGPYAVIRHPAYVCKNLAWWIGSIPLVVLEFERSWFGGVQAIASVAGWSMIYVLRALTEEDHLKSVDGEYAAYAAKVPHRFIPGVI